MGHFSDPGLPVGTSLILAALSSCALLDAGSKQKEEKAACDKRLARPSKNDCVGKPGGPLRPLANGCPAVPAEVA